MRRLIRAFAPERILLFGSYAKGMMDSNSDIDLLLIVRAPSAASSMLRRARQLAADCFPPVDVVFASPEEVSDAANAKSPFLSSILASGITAYIAADEAGRDCHRG